ncbi:hypothetical protein [Nonomuraea sediminis]|uniref:hypothetical protein n=1 Tax=Nonomuraea sediminis TaxID=2835864 RepID=UPI001BDD7E62|nr:hypothetical protein [Nonomuraea sediminis]
MAQLVGTYLAGHKVVKQEAKQGDTSVTLITDNNGTDLTADFGSGFNGRLIKTMDASYMQMPLGKEVAPGFAWDKITDYFEPYNLFGIHTLAVLANTLTDSYKVNEMFAATGRLAATSMEGNLTHYTIKIDTDAAIKKLDLKAYVNFYSHTIMMQKDTDRVEKVIAGDPAAVSGFRSKLSTQFGPSMTYELWTDRQGRPVRYITRAHDPSISITDPHVESLEVTFSEWDSAVVKAPPGDQTRVMHE